MSFSGMVVRQLRMLRGLFRVTRFMGSGSIPMRFSGFFVVSRCFVVVVFRHVLSPDNAEHLTGPY